MTVRSSSLRQNPAYRPGNPPLHPIWPLVLIAVTACSSRIPEQVILPPGPAPVRAEPSRRWILKPSAVASEYLFEQRAGLVITFEFGAPVTDSTILSVNASIRHVQGAGIAGLIRTVSIRAPSGVMAAPSGIATPFAFSAEAPVPGSLLAPMARPIQADPCSSAAHAALGALRDVLMRLPDTLVLGRAWADSGTFVTCRDGVRLEVATRRRFNVAAFEAHGPEDRLLITRSGTTTIRGSVVRGPDTTRVEGSGSATMRYEIDAETGDIRTARGTGILDIVVQGPVKSQRARQTSSVQMDRRLP